MAETYPDELDSDLVEIGRAYDSLEAQIWVRHLEEEGLHATMWRIGGPIRWLLYLGRVPVSVRVARRDSERARESLKKSRFI